MLPQKRPNPDSGTPRPKLNEQEIKIYQLIRKREGTGILLRDVKKEAIGIAATAVAKAVKSLQVKNLIKEVARAKDKKKIYMGVEFELAAEVSGGVWYQDGALDVQFIQVMRQQCMAHIRRFEIATVDSIHQALDRSPVFPAGVALGMVTEIVNLLALEREIEKMQSSGFGEFAHVPAGKECYRILKSRGGTKQGAMSSIPCGVCPRISECTPDGIISPVNCVYLDKWLGVDF